MFDIFVRTQVQSNIQQELADYDGNMKVPASES